MCRNARLARVDVSVPDEVMRRRPGIDLHRRWNFSALDLSTCEGIPVTSPICTLVDIAADLSPRQLEAAVNEAVKLDLFEYDELRMTATGWGHDEG